MWFLKTEVGAAHKHYSLLLSYWAVENHHSPSVQGVVKMHSGWGRLCLVLTGNPYLLSFWVMVPFSSFPAMEPSTLLASLAKSRSRTSAGDTGTMANASLSSFTGEVPIWNTRRSLWGRLLAEILGKHYIYGTLDNTKSWNYDAVKIN